MANADGFDIVNKKGEVVKALPQVHQIDFTSIKDKRIVLLIDGDIVAYRASATCDGREYLIQDEDGNDIYDESGERVSFKYKKEATKYIKDNDPDGVLELSAECVFIPEPVENAISNVQRTLKAIKKTMQYGSPADVAFEIYLTPESNFRDALLTDYKANRKGVRKPTHLKACKDELVRMGAKEFDGYEADDILGIRSTELNTAGVLLPIVVSLDKDLDMIPGFHYKWTGKDLYYTTEEEGHRAFYSQLLTGDRTDNIPGIHGIGPKTAAKILDETDGTPSNMFRRVLQEYVSKTEREVTSSEPDEKIIESDEDFYTRVLTTVVRNARMLYILKDWEEVWSPPV